MNRWLEAAEIYADRRIIAVLFLGFSSGLPLALTGATLSVWLVESGVSLTAIGVFAVLAVPYSLKFVWAPFIDGLRVPLLGRWLGRRRGWAILTQLAVMAAVLALGATNPGERPILTALFAFIVAFCSASQDTVIDAFRIEILEERQQGAGAAAVVFGYRLGMLVSGAGALYLATYASWLAAYAVMASLVTVGMAAILLTPEPLSYGASGPTGEDNASDGAAAWLRAYVLAPFTDFMRRPEWVIILLFILLYKFGDALAGVMANPFYVQLGFSKIEIADVSKIFGIGATIAGGLLGGVLVYRFGILRSLLACGILQMLSNLMFALQAIVGHDVAMLMLTVGIENMSGGMATAAFVAYVSALCNAAHTATQYALLSSLAALGRTVLSSSGGWLAEWLDWVDFFLLSTAAALPGLLLLIWLIRLQVVKSDAASAAGSASEVAREIRPRKLRKDG